MNVGGKGAPGETYAGKDSRPLLIPHAVYM
jgi:hypothetical protein